MPAAVFGRIVNRVLFPVMAQVQDDPERLSRAYERALAVVALVALPVSAFLLVVAPEFIPVLLGPAWTGVIVPFRLFTFSLLFHMSSMISDVLTTATGAVYARALRRAVYAMMVVFGALIGQQWGVGGVAVAVSLAMGVNYLVMAQLGRSVTGLSWGRFVRAQSPGALFAVVVGGTTLIVVEAARMARLGNLPLLALAGLSAAGITVLALRLHPKLFLGSHGSWAVDRGSDFFRKGMGRMAEFRAARPDQLASSTEANLK
jgi:PST family polysaccharide transporter